MNPFTQTLFANLTEPQQEVAIYDMIRLCGSYRWSTNPGWKVMADAKQAIAKGYDPDMEFTTFVSVAGEVRVKLS